MTRWKSNWDEAKQHFIDWWNREGLVVGAWRGTKSSGPPHEKTVAPSKPESIRDRYTNWERRAIWNHHMLSRQMFPADVLPVSDCHISPGDLALILGSEPEFSKETVWHNPIFQKDQDPEKLPPLVFDETNYWWQIMEQTVRTAVDLSQGKYLVGGPELMENMDVLAILRESQNLMFDMIDRPEWVERKINEINQAWFEAYQRIYDMLKMDDGSSVWGAFRVWGPGKTAKLQCDVSAMISPDLYDRFVAPGITAQCEWLDYSMYHLDGTQAICHLESLLNIDSLDAIEWTPQAGIETGGNPRWYDMYRKILEAGKSIQVLDVAKDEIIPLLDAVGSKGVYIMTRFTNAAEAQEIETIVDKYR